MLSVPAFCAPSKNSLGRFAYSLGPYFRNGKNADDVRPRREEEEEEEEEEDDDEEDEVEAVVEEPT